MIDGSDRTEFTLTCDHCEKEADDTFDTFQEAVEWKKDKDNGWWSVKNVFSDEWSDLCPDCHAPSIISLHKGIA